MRRMRKPLLILAVLVGVIGGISVKARSWWQQHSAPKYLTDVISRGRVETQVTSTGTVKPVLSVSVGAFTSGPIAKVFVDYNSVVKKGQLLAIIDPKLFEAAVERDRAALESQQADLGRVKALLQQAKNNEKRARDLRAINKDYLADIDLDQYYFTRLTYEAQVKLGEASIKQAEANLKNSEANLGYTEIRAPVDGIVIERKVDPGQTVAASFQTPELFTIAPEMEKHMYVFASVDEADIGQISSAQERGRTVNFTVDAYPGDLFEGKITQIRKNSTTTQNVVTYPVVIEAPNPKLKLLPGMTANITFPIEAKDNVLRVPAAALRFLPPVDQVRPEDRHYVEALPTGKMDRDIKHSASEKADLAGKRKHRIVWIQDGQQVQAVSLTLGLIDNQFAEILSGAVTEGQAVVTGTEGLFGPR
jgi:HlyD family secretion protein